MSEQAVSTYLAPVGSTARFCKTVGEADIYLFAGITGDLNQNHVDEEFMRSTRYAGRVAHGALLVGFMSNTSTRVIEQGPRPAVSLGFDRIRFTGPVYIGDTITVEYVVTEQDPARDRTVASVTITNQRGEVVAVATHILKFI